jgi:hypothetical protein
VPGPDPGPRCLLRWPRHWPHGPCPLTHHPFTITDYANPSLTRPFGSAAQMAEEQREVRVWGGIHYRNSLVVSDEMGRRIAAYLVANSMKPAR